MRIRRVRMPLLAAAVAVSLTIIAGAAAAQQSRVFVASTLTSGKMFGVGGLAGGD